MTALIDAKDGVVAAVQRDHPRDFRRRFRWRPALKFQMSNWERVLAILAESCACLHPITYMYYAVDKRQAEEWVTDADKIAEQPMRLIDPSGNRAGITEVHDYFVASEVARR